MSHAPRKILGGGYIEEMNHEDDKLTLVPSKYNKLSFEIIKLLFILYECYLN